MTGRPDRLAIVSFLVWVAGALAARRVGLWLGVGIASVLLGAATLALRATPFFDGARPRAPRLLLGVAAGAAMTIATYALYPLVIAVAPSSAHEAHRLYASFAALPPGPAALLLVPVIVGEELAWRGVVQPAVARRIGATAGALVAAALYALAHAAVGSWLLVLLAFGCGVVFCVLRAAGGDLLAPLAAHLVWDVCVLVLWPLAR